MAEANGVTLLAACGVASALVTGVVDKEDGDRERSLEVSKELIVEARGRGKTRPDRRYLPGGGGDVDRAAASTRTASARADRSADGRWQIRCTPSHQAHTPEA